MVALPPSFLPRSASARSKKLSQKWSIKKWIQSLLLAVWTMSTLMGGLIYSAPQAHAAVTSFDTLFEDCTDDPNEATWSGIKVCLQGVTMDARYQPVWSGVIRPKLVQFFDSHALSGGGIEDTILHKDFMFGATFPSNASLDSQINLMLTSEGDGKDNFEEIGDVFDKALEGDRAAVLCQLYHVPPVVLYGTEGVASPDYDDSGPLTCDSDNATNDNFLVKGLSAATIYLIADIIATDNFVITSEDNPRLSGLIGDVKTMMGEFKTYLGDDNNLVTPRRANPRSPHKNLRAFYSANMSATSVLASDGPIESLLLYCQATGLRGRLSADSTPVDYINAVKDCYERALTDTARPMSDRAKEFVRNILKPATEAYARKVSAFADIGNREKAKEFMQDVDYVQLGEAYDALAARRSEYPMADYLSETINDGYTDSVSWTQIEYEADGVTPKIVISSNGPITYFGDFSRSVRQVIAWHAYYINEALTSEQNYTIFLDRPLVPAAAAPAPAAPSTTGTNADVAAQNRQLFLNEVRAVRRVQVQSNRNVLKQLNEYITRSADAGNKPIMMFAWFWLATESHDPTYSGAPEHFTGDLSLVSESIPADSAVAQFFSDPYLARITNACSPNTFSDTVQKADLEPWKKCLEHEQEFVDKSDSARTFKPHNTGSETNFTMTLGSGLEPFRIRRSQPVVEAMQSMIATIQSCIDRPACLSLDDRDVGDQGTLQSGNNPGARDPGDSMLSAILSIINLILGLIIKFLLWLTALVMSFFQSVLSYAGFTTSDFVVKMWKAVRDFVNLFFILALLGIAVANIVQYEINNYAVKTILPKLIVIVIAVNFSRLIVGLGIDAGNVLEAGIYQIAGMGPHGGGTQAACSTTTTQVGTLDVAIPQDIKDGSILCRLAKGLRFQELQNYRENGSRDESTLTSLFLINIAILLILIMMLFGFLALAITFTIRIIVLWALAITSPLFVISKISPMGSGVSSEWQSKFVKYAFMQVKVAFFLTLAVLASEAVGSQIFAGLANTSPAVGGGTLSPVGFNSLADYLQLVFVIAMIYAAAFTAAKGDYGNGLVDSIAKYGQNPLSSLQTGAKYVGKAAGFGFNATQYIGHRMQDKQGAGWGSKLIRGAGSLIASPTNIYSGGKAIVGDLQQRAKERKERFGAITAHTMARPFGQSMRDRFQATIVKNENTLIEAVASDATRRFDAETIRRKAQAAFGSKDYRSYAGFMQALAKQGAADFDEAILDSSGKERQIRGADGKMRTMTLRDQFLEAETLRNPTGAPREEAERDAQKLLEEIENTNFNQGKALFDQGKGFAARTNDKNFIRQRLDEAISKGNKQLALGILAAAFEGRIQEGDDEGAGIALEYWQRMQRADNMKITGNDRRKMSKDLAKEGVASIGIMLGAERRGDGGGEKDHMERIYAAAKELQLIDQNAADYYEIKNEEQRRQAEHIVSILAATGRYRANGKTYYLSESEIGRAAAKMVEQNQLNAFNEVKLSGDDGNIKTMIQQLEASSVALGSSMTESGKFRADTKMIREAMRGYIENLAVIGRNANGAVENQGAIDFNKAKFDEYLKTLAGTITTQAQVTAVDKMLDDIKRLNPTNRDFSDTQKANVAAQIEAFRAELKRQASQKPLAAGAGRSGGGEDDTPPPAPAAS